MNILLVLQEKPQPHNTGAWQRTYLLWEALKQIGEVYAVYFDNQKGNCPQSSTMKQIRMHKISRVLHYKLITPLRLIQAIEFTPLKPITQQTIQSIYPNIHFDVMVCRYIHCFAKFHLWDLHLPVLLDLDDHPLQIYDTSARTCVPRYLQRLGRKVIQWQMAYLMKKIDGLWISDIQQTELVGNKRNISLLRNIPQLPSDGYQRAAHPKPFLLTVGTMSYAPNYHGVTRFLQTTWPSMHQKYPEMEYIIVGKEAPDDIAAKWTAMPNVTYRGYVDTDELQQLYADCMTTVVPIYEGSGTCIKTLESLSHCVPCLTTQFGARGIHYDGDMEEISMYIYHTTADFTELFSRIKHIEDTQSKQLAMKAFIENYHNYQEFIHSVHQLILPLTLNH